MSDLQLKSIVILVASPNFEQIVMLNDANGTLLFVGGKCNDRACDSMSTAISIFEEKTDITPIIPEDAFVYDTSSGIRIIVYFVDNIDDYKNDQTELIFGIDILRNSYLNQKVKGLAEYIYKEIIRPNTTLPVPKERQRLEEEQMRQKQQEKLRLEKLKEAREQQELERIKRILSQAFEKERTKEQEKIDERMKEDERIARELHEKELLEEREQRMQRERSQSKPIRKKWDSSSSEEDEEKDEEEPDECSALRGLKNKYNSCYLDSVLVALFAIDNEFINKEIFDKDVSEVVERKKNFECDSNARTDRETRTKIQDELKRITWYIRGVEHERIDYCTKLREMFEQCNPETQEFYSRNMQDAGEFLNFLFDVFNVEGMKYIQTSFFTNSQNPQDVVWKEGTRSEYMGSPSITVGSFLVNQIKDGDELSKFLIQEDLPEGNHLYDGVYYSRRSNVTQYIPDKYMVFNVSRVSIDEKTRRQVKYRNPIIAPPEIGHLYLFAVVVHEGKSTQAGHYTCYLSCNGIWYYYDDLNQRLESRVKLVGSFEQMTRSEPSIKTDGTLFFYTANEQID